jgi:hypothetical protein
MVQHFKLKEGLDSWDSLKLNPDGSWVHRSDYEYMERCYNELNSTMNFVSITLVGRCPALIPELADSLKASGITSHDWGAQWLQIALSLAQFVHDKMPEMYPEAAKLITHGPGSLLHQPEKKS